MMPVDTPVRNAKQLPPKNAQMLKDMKAIECDFVAKT